MQLAVRYRRATHDRETGLPIAGVGWEQANQSSGGIVHLLSPSAWMWLEEVCTEALRYNADFHEQAFNNDPKVIQRGLNILVSAGMVETQNVVWVVTHGHRYSAIRERVIGVTPTPEMAKRMADEWWSENREIVEDETHWDKGCEPIVTEAVLSE